MSDYKPQEVKPVEYKMETVQIGYTRAPLKEFDPETRATFIQEPLMWRTQQKQNLDL